MIQQTLVKANACIVDVQEDLVTGIVNIVCHTRVAPGTDCYDFIISKTEQPCLIYKPERTNDRLSGFKVIKTKDN